MRNRTYSGTRSAPQALPDTHWLDRGVCKVYVGDGRALWELEEPPSARQDNEEPWEWGCVCDAAHRLALAVLTDALADRERALKICTAFCQEVVKTLPFSTWTLTAPNLRGWAEGQEIKMGLRPPRTGGRPARPSREGRESAP